MVTDDAFLEDRPGDTSGMTAQAIFAAAEQERKHGDSRTAIVLYRQARDKSDTATDVWITSAHMGAVCHRVIGEFQTSLTILNILLKDPRASNECLLRAHILRDKADTLRNMNRLEEAYATATESFELYIEYGGSLAEIGATRAFMARIAWDESDKEAARTMASEAADELRQDDNREVELYHLVFYARIEAQFDPKHAQLIATNGLQLCSKGFGKDIHRKRLRIILDHAHNTEALNAALSQLDKTAVK